MRRLGITHHLTTAFHPQSNGIIERAHRQLKDTLRACLAGPDWLNHLPWVLLDLRGAQKEYSALSSAEMQYGTPLSLPGQPPPYVEESPAEACNQLPMDQQFIPLCCLYYADAMKSPAERLRSSSHVYVRHGGASPPLSALYRFFVLQIGDSTESISVDHLKPHSGPSPVLLAAPLYSSLATIQYFITILSLLLITLSFIHLSN